jgi:DNA-binding MarR family transcriptional regulator
VPSPSGQKGSPGGSPSSRAASTFEQEFPGLSESANRVAVELVRSSEALLSATDRVVTRHQLSRGGREALAVLEGAGEPLSPTTIAERLMVTTASVTSLLDTLERRGLLTRERDPRDRRKLLVALTDEGRALVDRFLPEVVALQSAAMSTLTEAQRTQLHRLLARVHAGIAEVDTDSVARAAPRRGPHPAG